MIFYHQRFDFRMGDEIFNIALLKYFKLKYGCNFYYQDVNRFFSSIEIFPDNLVVFASENFYDFPNFYSGNLWFWNQMLREKQIYVTSCIEYDAKAADIDVVFIPLLNPDYYLARGMKIEMTIKFIDLIIKAFPNSKIIIDYAKRKFIENNHTNIVFSSNIYEAFDFIKRSKIYIGGDTGVSHFAGAINHPNMILLYPDENVLEEKLGAYYKKEIVDLFGEKEVLDFQYSSLPCCDPKNFQNLQLVANEISTRQLLVAIDRAKQKTAR